MGEHREVRIDPFDSLEWMSVSLSEYGFNRVAAFDVAMPDGVDEDKSYRT